jgi:hypothetical protein
MDTLYKYVRLKPFSPHPQNVFMKNKYGWEVVNYVLRIDQMQLKECGRQHRLINAQRIMQNRESESCLRGNVLQQARLRGS